jgi:hypothetical protein
MFGDFAAPDFSAARTVETENANTIVMLIRRVMVVIVRFLRLLSGLDK